MKYLPYIHKTNMNELKLNFTLILDSKFTYEFSWKNRPDLFVKIVCNADEVRWRRQNDEKTSIVLQTHFNEAVMRIVSVFLEQTNTKC